MKKLHHIIQLFSTGKTSIASSALLLMVTCMSLSAQAQYVVNFEAETKAAYAAAAVTLNGKSWNMDDALIGNLAQDVKNGTKSARVRNTGSLTMLTDMTNGISTVTVYHGGYSAESGNWLLEASTDGGTNWTAYVSPSQSAAGALQLVSFTLNLPGTVRIRLRKTSGGTNRINFDDITITDYVPLNTPPVVVAPTVTAIQPNSARLGANVTGTGNSPIAARGIVWSTTANPAVGQPGATQVTVPDSTGVFDAAVTGLPAGTQIFFRGFATNSTGTGYTANTSFYTLSTAPSGPVTNLTATGISNHDIRVDWTAVPGASGYVVLQKMYTAPTSFPVNATKYTAGTMLGDADIVAVIPSGTVQTATYSGLISGTVYQYAVIPYRFNGTNTETYNYYTQPVVPIAFDTTLGTGPSAISDLIGLQNSEALTIASIINDTLNADSNGIQVWKLALRDGGSSLHDADDMPTIVSKIVITKGTKNSVPVWQNTLQFAALFDDSTSQKVADALIYPDSMVFANIGFTANDDNMKTYSLRLSLKKTNIRDNDTLQFSIKRSNIVMPSLNVSSQIPALNIQSDSSRNKITVTATRFVITQQPPATARVNTILAPAFRLEVQDANGNRDLDHNSPVFVYPSKGTLANAPVIKTAVNGQLIFDSIIIPSIAQGIILKVKTQNLDTAYSNPINVYASTQSDIVTTAGFTYSDSIPYVYYQQGNDLDPYNTVAVYSFTLRDGGALANDPDIFPTVLSSISFALQGNDYIRRAALFQGNVRLAETAVTGSLLSFGNLHITAPDNDSITITLRATFNSRYAHGQRIRFTVQQATADTAAGSLFAFTNAGGASSSITGGNNVLKYTPVYVTAPVAVNTTTCKAGAAKLTAVKAPNSILRWYTSAAAQTAVYTGDTLLITQPAATTSYFVEADSSGWTSARVEVRVTVTNVTAPSVSPVTVCRNNAATLSTTSANTVSWYSSFTSETPVYSGPSLMLAAVTRDTLFYVQADSAMCKSERVPVTVSVKRVTAPVIPDTTICKNSSVALTSAPNSNTIKWYAQANAGTAIATGEMFTSGAIPQDTVFYAETDSSGCKSERVPVQVTIRQVSKPLIAQDSITICSGNSASFTASSNGTINWYPAASGGASLFTGASFSTPVLTTAATYYVASTERNCASTRVPVYAAVKAVPPTPAVTPVTSCSGSVATLTVTAASATVLWYDGLTGGTLLYTGSSYTTPALSGNTEYFVESNLNGCISPRVTFPVTIKAIPAQPTAANATVCSGNSVKLKATAAQGTIRWFAGITDTASLADRDSLITPLLLQQTSYYVAAVLNGCSSTRRVVTVTVNPTPDATFTVNQTDQCLYNNQFILTNALHQPDAQYSWNFGDSTSLNLSNPVKTYNRTGSFTVKLKATSTKGCMAETQRTVTVNAPAVNFAFTATGRTVNFTTALSNIASYKWMFTPQDSASGSSPVFTFPASGTYTVTLIITDNNGCINTITKQVQVLSTGTAELLTEAYRLNVFPNPVTDHATVSYTLAQAADVTITLYDLQGKMLKEVCNTRQASGDHETRVDLESFTASAFLLKIAINGQYQAVKLISQ